MDEISLINYSVFKGFPLLHGTTNRFGGVSPPPFEKLNLGDSTGDTVNHVTCNQKRLENHLRINPLVHTTQVHGIDSIYIDQHPGTAKLPPADILLTNKIEIPLMIKHADCQAAIFFDPEHHALAVVHAGWRGQLHGVYEETVRLMHHHFGSAPQKLRVAISPSLGKNQAEFKNYQTEFPERLWTYQVKPLYFDLKALARDTLLSIGIRDEHLEISPLCTFEDQQFFSYRRDKNCGRMGTFAMLAPVCASK